MKALTSSGLMVDKMRVLLTILLFLSFDVFGKPFSDIQNLLHKKDFPSLESYMNSAAEFGSLYWKTLREITKDNYEGVIEIQETKALDSNGSNVNSYTIRILSTSKKIFYYEVVKWIYVGVPQILDSFKDSEKYLDFKNSFAAAYHTAPDEKELFETKIVYGSSCGISGEPTISQEKLDSLIQEKNIPTILSWLRSANTEKQLYAIQGLHRLERNGHSINRQDKEIIKMIGQKQGKVNTCSGCLHTSISISEMVKGLNFRHSKFFKRRQMFWGVLIGFLLLSIFLAVLYKKRKAN